MSDEQEGPATQAGPGATATGDQSAGKATDLPVCAPLPPQSANTGVGQNDPGVACVTRDPLNPEAGKGGIVPPRASRWKAGDPSPNPSGRKPGLSLTGTFRKFADAGLSNETLLAIVGGKDKRYKKPVHRMAARHLLDTIVKGKSLDIAYERIDGKVPQATVEISLTPAQAQAMTDDEIRDLLRR